MAENGIVDGVKNLVGSKTENVVVLAMDGMVVNVETRRSQGNVCGLSSDGVWFGDADGLEEWLSQVMINDDKNPKETETLIIDLSDSSNSPPPPPPPPTQFGNRLLMGNASMEATSVLPITPVMNGDARISPVSSDDGQAPHCHCMRIGMDYDICGFCREMEKKQYERSEKDSVC